MTDSTAGPGSDDDSEPRKYTVRPSVAWSPEASQYLTSLRGIDTRDKLFAHAVGFGLVFGAFFPCLSPSYIALTDTSRESVGVESLLAFKNQTTIMVMFATIIVFCISLGLGRSGVRKVVGQVLGLLRFLRVRHPSIARVIDSMRATERRPPGQTQTVGLLLSVLAGWYLMLELTQRTGGVTRSPFLQFAVSMFAWQLLLAENFWFKTVTFAAASGFVLMSYLLPLEDFADQLEFSAGYFAIVTFGNLIFQLLPAYFAWEERGAP